MDELKQARLHLFYGGHLARRGSFEQAEQHLVRAVERTSGKWAGTLDTHPDDVLVEFIALYDAWGRAEKADGYRGLRQACIEARLRAAGD